MVRPSLLQPPAAGRSPHPRGDGPQGIPDHPRRCSFSPPAWGWSLRAAIADGAHVVLPTRVGMVLRGWPWASSVSGSPHPRGDGPSPRPHRLPGKSFSPPAWGWSSDDSVMSVLGIVLPTRVGMVLGPCKPATWQSGSPHPRGDGPIRALATRRTGRFSPPAWGWSAAPALAAASMSVLPTRVGMVPARPVRRGPARSSPHPRGDGPSHQ